MSWFSEMFSGKKDQEAAASAASEAAGAQRRAEKKRQDDIRAGQASIETAFGQFDPAYYDKFKATYTGNYLPQIADQYDRAKGKLTATLAGRGTLESTVGAAKFGDLDQTRGVAQAEVGNRATDAANELRGKVEGAKSDLYTLNTSAADPQGISARAIGAATSIAAPPSMSPLGQVFSSALGAFGTFNKADATSMAPRLPWNMNAGFAPTSGAGSSMLVR